MMMHGLANFKYIHKLLPTVGRQYAIRVTPKKIVTIFKDVLPQGWRHWTAQSSVDMEEIDGLC
jgi:hypothetical protein